MTVSLQFFRYPFVGKVKLATGACVETPLTEDETARSPAPTRLQRQNLGAIVLRNSAPQLSVIPDKSC